MNITAVIAEYNPFHNGHQYQLDLARKQTHADYVIVIMNGDFMQRGVPAYWNKYTRAAMAVAHGADAVFELPVLYGTGSAEFFARGGVRLLQQLNCVQHLCFGCETDDLELLNTLAALFVQEPEEYRLQLNKFLSQGISFPKARAQAASDFISLPGYSKQDLEALLTQPNTILGLEYIKALLREHSQIQPVPCLRTDNGYHHEGLEHSFASATAIRKKYGETGCMDALSHVLPASVYADIQQAYQHRSPIDMEDFYPYLQYCLWKPEHALTDYLDISEDLANRIRGVYRPEYSYQEFVEAIVNKQYTYTRIYRCLLHLLLDIRKHDMQMQLESNSMHYARLLAFRKDSSALLKIINTNSDIPVINKVTDGLRTLDSISDSYGTQLLQLDIAAAHLYEQTITNRYKVPAINEFTKGVIIL